MWICNQDAMHALQSFLLFESVWGIRSCAVRSSANMVRIERTYGTFRIGSEYKCSKCRREPQFVHIDRVVVHIDTSAHQNRVCDDQPADGKLQTVADHLDHASCPKRSDVYDLFGYVVRDMNPDL